MVKIVKPTLRFARNEILGIADRYKDKGSVLEAELIALKPTVDYRGFLRKAELEKVAHWKAPRSAGHSRKNSEDYVIEITKFALATSSERAEVESLTLLDGVSWPSATAILHLFHRDPYPILDFRALWSVSLDVPTQYTFDFWWIYVGFCRDLARTVGVDMRTLDRALWQYSKENQ